MNLPVFGSSFCRNCKVLAVACALCFCVGCGGGETPATEDTASPAVSTDVTPPSQDASPVAAKPGAEEGTASDTASGEVAVGDGTSVESGSSAAPAKASTRAKKKIVTVRDPFANLVAPSAPKSRVAPKAKGPAAVGAKRAAVRAKSKNEGKPAAKPVAKGPGKPAVKVTGIFPDGDGGSAIIQSEKGTRMVHTGEVISGYKVAAVVSNASKKCVVFVWKDKWKYEVPLETETFSSIGTGASKSAVTK